MNASPPKWLDALSATMMIRIRLPAGAAAFCDSGENCSLMAGNCGLVNL
jgi:hypothetical protein